MTEPIRDIQPFSYALPFTVEDGLLAHENLGSNGERPDDYEEYIRLLGEVRRVHEELEKNLQQGDSNII